MNEGPVSHPPTKPRRPLVAVVALVVVSALGMGGVMSGCGTLQFYRQSTHPALEIDASVTADVRAHLEARHAGWIQALDTNHGRMIPLAAANVLLSALLVVACARALSGRPGSQRLALQAIAANITFAIVDFLASGPLRDTIIAAVARHPPAQVESSEIVAAYEWGYRILLAVQLALLGFAAYAMTRPTVLASYEPDDHDEEA